MEARIYKPKRHRNGKRTTGRLYRARVKLTGDNKVRDISLGVSDKQVAQQKLNKLIQELEHESAGLIPAKAEREAAQSPLLDLISEYVNELTVLGRSADHLRHVDKRLRRLVRECHWARLADVTPASFQSWRKEQASKAPKTLNEYLATLSAFWTWLRKQSRVTVNPFELVERTDTRGKERVQRRALSDAQAIQLLQVAGKNQLAYPMHFRGEGKTSCTSLPASRAFYPMHFRGEGKTLLANIAERFGFYPMHFRGEGKTRAAVTVSASSFYPMHFRGEGKTLASVSPLCSAFYPMHFRGEGKTSQSTCLNGATFYPMHFRGEGKTSSRTGPMYWQFYPMHFRGEGKTKLAAGWPVRLNSNFNDSSDF